ncbi:MAG: uroporphyrinogen decarboxylase [Anaerolineae bacterium]|nr:MAG: uroporphyrinogen decarboxylase [Anaerolineae bacterium]
MTLSHRERMESCLAGETPDRPPVALWRHFPVDDQAPGSLAAATVNFQQVYDFDFVKITPASSFCLKDWGVQDAWRGNPEGTRAYTHRVIENPEDWTRLQVLDPSKGFLSHQLEAIRLIVAALDQDTPVIQTIFSPLAQAKNLAGGERLLVHLRSAPDAVRIGLQIITESIQRFVEAAKPLGIAGIFYAVQHARLELLSAEEYRQFGRPFDLSVLESVQDLWLNVLHLHGTDILFDDFTEYPVHVLNWHDQETPPSLAEAQKRFDGVVCGGLRQWQTMVLGTADDVYREARAAIEATQGRRFILGTGCVTPITAPFGNLWAARQAVEAEGNA